MGTNWLGYDTVAPISGTNNFAPNQILPSSGADPQDWYYLFYSMPGSTARRIGEERVCNPLWNVYGCREAQEPDQVTAVVPKNELPPQYQAEHEEGEEGEAPQYGTMGHADMVTDSYDTLGDIAVPVIMASFAFLGVASIYEKIKG
jgi:hypothetical protein